MSVSCSTGARLVPGGPHVGEQRRIDGGGRAASHRAVPVGGGSRGHADGEQLVPVRLRAGRGCQLMRSTDGRLRRREMFCSGIGGIYDGDREVEVQPRRRGWVIRRVYEVRRREIRTGGRCVVCRIFNGKNNFNLVA